MAAWSTCRLTIVLHSSSGADGVFRAKRSLGQNFLVDENLQRKIIAALEPDAGDDVFEIGPGTGALTQHLAGVVRRLVAIELDDTLAARLQLQYQTHDDVAILHRDAMDVDPAEVGDIATMKGIGNIPYNITTPLLFRLLSRAWRPRCLVLMVQKEVADRIVAPPGGKEYGALSVGVRTVAQAERLFVVPRGAFRPVPNVESAVLRITPLRPAPLTEAEERAVRTLTRVAFGWRRKQLQRVLRSAPEYAIDEHAVADITRELGIDPQTRAETLGPDEFVRLARALQARGLPLDNAPAES
jgi:16S rRNA (adenine1518-N6/adenine1519-N6)-dimethyltransferase